jgi:transcriptional adapter 2-alpha
MKPRSAAEIENHYVETYAQSPYAPLPIPAVQPRLPPPVVPNYDTRAVDSCPSEAHDRNLQLKNKKERTIPAEFNGYMPFRHEFELDFNNEAETLVATIAFSESETNESFAAKVTLLLSYNSQLAERKLRTKVIEDFGIQYQEAKTGKADSEPGFLGGYSPLERRIDARLLPLAPYVGAQRIQELANDLHRGIRVMELIRDRKVWQENGVKTHQEGHFFNGLSCLIKDGRIQGGDVERWNETVERFRRSVEPDKPHAKFLNAAEAQLCEREGIEMEMYLAIKGLIVREYAFRERLSRDEAIGLCPPVGRAIAAVYDLSLKSGWITN